MSDRSTLKGYFNTGDRPTENQFADLIDSMSLTTETASVQSALNDYEKRYKSPIPIYSSGLLSRVDYSDGTYKLFTWTNGLLTRVDHVRPTLTTIRKDITYSAGVWSGTTETEI